MSRRREVVVEQPRALDDDLLLPRPPGVLRRFWARHPRVADIVLAFLALLLSLPAATIRASSDVAPSMMQVWIAIGMVVVGSAALVFRRRRPILVFAIAAIPSLLLPPSLVPVAHLLLGFAIYAIAVYRSVRACWIAFGAIVLAIAAYSVLAGFGGWDTIAYLITNGVAAVVTVLIGALLGVNVGNRRRYLEALIDRSRQLAIERDQQAQLAAAAERTRIAREMHDIVAHSLTVVVALSEGAIASTSLERAQQASRASADTARAALHEMRAMLGVLRDVDDETSPLEPLEPVEPSRVVSAAQQAGFPVVLETIGSTADAPRSVRFALGRVVQEGVTNAMRHAPSAQAVRVRVQTDLDRITVLIRNDGVRSAPGPRSRGFGLRGLRERIDHAGGALEAGPDGVDGWRVHATLPLSAPPPEETP